MPINLKQRLPLNKISLWHRRIGLFLLVWVIFVALTGVALNHSKAFDLESLPLPRAILEGIYGIEPPEVESYFHKGDWLSLVAGDQLYRNRQRLGFCPGLRGAATLAGETYVACSDSLYLLDHRGEIIEQIGAGLGLPTPIDAFGHCGGQPCLESAGQVYRFDPADFSWSPGAADSFEASVPGETPSGLYEDLARRNSPPDFNGERLVRDLHSGVFFGLGPWLMDLFALVLVTLSVTGLIQWWLRRR